MPDANVLVRKLREGMVCLCWMVLHLGVGRQGWQVEKCVSHSFLASSPADGLEFGNSVYKVKFDDRFFEKVRSLAHKTTGAKGSSLGCFLPSQLLAEMFEMFAALQSI